MKKILIVEDDPFIALDLQCVLEDAGYEVIGPVADVKSGIELIEKANLNAGILDYNLGTEKSTPIAALLGAKKIPFAILSGQSLSTIKADMGDEADIILKPVAPEVILDHISNMIN